MVDVVIVGSVALDSVKTPFGEKKDVLGGAATYSSVAAALFSAPGIVGVVGDDFPKQHMDFLRSKGVSLDGLDVKEGKTFRWAGYYEYDMNQAHTTDTQLNLFSSFSPKVPDSYLSAKYVFLANIDPILQKEVFSKYSGAKLVALDTMNFWISSKKQELLDVISKVDLLLINDAEARELMGTPNLVAAARGILKKGPKFVVIKKGEHGALLFTDGVCFAAPAYPLEVVRDPTGAGDSFAGAIMGYIAATDDISVENLRRAVVYGSAVASLNVEDFSLEKLGKVTKSDVERRFEEFKVITGF